MEKVTVNSKKLWQALGLVANFVQKNTRDKNAFILIDAVKISFLNGVCEIEAITNFTKKAVITFETNDQEAAFCFVTEFKRLFQFLNPDILPEREINITANKNSQIEIEYGGKIRQSFKDCELFPSLNFQEIEKNEKIFLGFLKKDKKLITDFRKTPLKEILFSENLKIQGNDSPFAFHLISTPKQKIIKISKETDVFLIRYYYLIEAFSQIQEEEKKILSFLEKPKERPPIIEEEKPKKTKKQPKEQPKEQSKTPIQNSIEECKKALSEFQAKQKAIKAENIRKELLTNASPEEATKIQELSTTELLAKANPKPRIDVFSKEKIESLVLKNIQNRQKNIPKTQKNTISEDKIKQVVNELYNELDKIIDKLLKN